LDVNADSAARIEASGDQVDEARTEFADRYLQNQCSEADGGAHRKTRTLTARNIELRVLIGTDRTQHGKETAEVHDHPLTAYQGRRL